MTMLLKLCLCAILLAIGVGAGNQVKSKTQFDSSGKTDFIKWETIVEEYKRLFDTQINKHLKELYKMYKSLNITGECQVSMDEYIRGLRNMKGWAIHMADASGKIPSGILGGTILDMGSFDDCLRIRVNDSFNGQEAFRGRYCLVGFRTSLLSPMSSKTPSGQTYVEAFGQPPDWAIETLSKTGAYLKHAALWFGTCVPSTCSEHDVRQISYYVTEPLKFDIKVAGCSVDEPQTWSTSAVISVCILSFILGLCLFGTTVDVILRCLFKKCGKQPEPDYLLLQLLKAFSLLSNTEQLFTIQNGNSTLACFHGLRFFSATWIILGHTYFFTDTWKFLKYRNGLNINNLFSFYLPAAVLENFSIPVGSFFVMSGFLLVYSTWRTLEKNAGKLNLFMFIVHKYWRMTPALILMIVLFLAMPLIGSGPLWDSTLDPPIEACQARWWTHLLYINNWWGSEDYCIVHTWYLPALMQFHLIGVIILLLAYRRSFLGLLLGSAVGIGSCVVTALLTVWYNFPMPAASTVRDMDIMEQYNSKIYIKPYCHVPSYLIGMAFGYLFLKHKDIKIGWKCQVSCWVVAILSALGSVYGLYGFAESVEVRAFYISCHRIGWALGVGWLSYACITRRGGIINRLLSWQAFVPLGQLSYLVYLVHPLIMLYRTASLRERVNYGHNELVFEFLNCTVISFFMAFIGHIAVEKPFLILEQIIFKSKASADPLKGEKIEEPPVWNSIAKTINP